MRNILYALTCVLASLIFLYCSKAQKALSGASYLPGFMKIGHRGTRGLVPENTIPSMNRAIELGANTIELDVHVSKDGKIIVYHDESVNPLFTTLPDGTDFSEKDREKYRFYQMNYTDIRSFIVGNKAYPAYPDQLRIASYIPLLSELIDSVEAFTRSRKLPEVYYLVEIKSKEKTDGIEQPAPEQYINLLMAELATKNLGRRLIIQSFDMRPLQVLHRKYPGIALGFLTDNRKASFEDNLLNLGFTPAFYNPHFSMVDEELVRKCHKKKIRISPWTVNTLKEMKRQKEFKVDGIITDYPNLFNEL